MGVKRRINELYYSARCAPLGAVNVRLIAWRSPRGVPVALTPAGGAGGGGNYIRGERSRRKATHAICNEELTG